MKTYALQELESLLLDFIKFKFQTSLDIEVNLYNRLVTDYLNWIENKELDEQQILAQENQNK